MTCLGTPLVTGTGTGVAELLVDEMGEVESVTLVAISGLPEPVAEA